MGLKNLIFGGSRKEIHCSLCGSTESTPTAGFTTYRALRQKLLGVPEWMAAHAVDAGIPDIEPEHRQAVGDPQVPDLGAGDDPEHRRCAQCKTLLPPQFWRNGPASQLAMTVAGAKGQGKTTWLMAVLSPPRYSRYSIIGFNDNHTVDPYDFVEPYTIKMLDLEFRTSIPYLLMGCSIRYSDVLVDVRTLDVRGERFRTSLSDVRQRIEHHLTGRRGGGALLIVERFTVDEAERGAATIAQEYSRISNGIRAKQRRGDVLWKAIVWTHLDQARWTPEGEAWLKTAVSNAEPFIRLGKGMPRYDSPDVIPLYEEIRGNDDLLLRELLVALRDSTSIGALAIEAVAALLFRLQLLYSAYVAKKRVNTLDYFYTGEGRLYVRFCQELAKQLYIQWDAPLGGISRMLTGAGEDDDWQVIPCGRIVEPNQAPESVWNDQIVIEAIARVMMR